MMSNNNFEFWKPGETLGRKIFFDTETTLIDKERPGDPPTLVLLAATDGRRTVIVRTHDVAEFVRLHADRVWLGYNCAGFDFQVIDRYLRERGHDDVARFWWDVAADNRLHDLMMRDQLIQLARDGRSAPKKRNLAEALKIYTDANVPDKESPYRLRFQELLDADWNNIDPGFFQYAVEDVAALRELDTATAQAAAGIMIKHKGRYDENIARYCGLLTEHVQVKGTIALREIEINGIRIDEERASSAREALQTEIHELIIRIAGDSKCANLFRRDKQGLIMFTETGAPKTSNDELRRLLEWARQEANKKGAKIPSPPRTETGLTSTSADFWGGHRGMHPFIQAWFDLQDKAKLLALYRGIQGDIHPQYNVLVRTGRTSCSKPNIQQMPRSEGFRECFVPREGYLFLAADYTAVEMVGLAATCEFRYRQSALADALRAGVDPHVNTAALIQGLSVEDFLALKGSELGRYKAERQKAKALNFGIPGGLGVDALMSHARSAYGVELDRSEAESLRSKFTAQIYPEIGRYLDKDNLFCLAMSLGIEPAHLRGLIQRHLNWDNIEGAVGLIRRIAAGESSGRTTSKAYNPKTVESVWRLLHEACAYEELRSLIVRRKTGSMLAAKLFSESAVTLTGRIRGNIDYTAARNTPFQGLCADGAKLALFDLARSGYRVAAFVHDEVLIELPEGANHTEEAKKIERIMCGAMDTVTGGRVPSKVEYALADCWSKEAHPIFDDSGRLLPWRYSEEKAPSGTEPELVGVNSMTDAGG